MNVVVLAGGRSAERAVSLSSGEMVCRALRRRGHRVLLLDLWRGMTDREVSDAPMRLFRADGEAVLSPLPGGDAPIGENVLRLCALADMVFPVLHGGAGENGMLQAMLDGFAIPYTGSGFAASALAMDKPLSKLVLRQGGIPTPDWCLLPQGAPWAAVQAEIAARVGYPCVIKPCEGGSSVGVHMVADECCAKALWRDLSVGGERFMAERRIFGRELTAAVLGGEVLPPVEIIPREGFYDYENKYIPGRTEELCPAPLSGETAAALARQTRRAFDLLSLRGYGRGDFILDGDGVLWCLEFNTLPGMTPTSLLPREAQAAGMDFDELCDRMLSDALLYNKGK